MKAVNRASRILKIAGVTLILISLVLALYALLNTGKGWGAMNEGTAFPYNFFDKLRFDDDYLSALSAAAADGRTEMKLENQDEVLMIQAEKI